VIGLINGGSKIRGDGEKPFVVEIATELQTWKLKAAMMGVNCSQEQHICGKAAVNSSGHNVMETDQLVIQKKPGRALD
jgi:lipopolysaccharide export system protein LptA